MAYKVKDGETLSSIARANNTTVDEILKTNPSITNPNTIRPGQDINLPNNTYGNTSSAGGSNAAPNSTAPRTQTTQGATSPAAASSPSGSTATTQPSIATDAQSYKDIYDSIMAEGYKPSYTGEWGEKQKEILGDYESRGDFEYDINGDMIYQQLADEYERSGKAAAEDTLGKAAAMNGGYGSSYGNIAAQTAYNSHMQELNSMIPELEERAYARDQAEKEELLRLISLYGDLDSIDYERDQIAKDSWEEDVDRAYSKWRDRESWEHQLDREEVEDAWRQQEWDYMVDQDTFSNLLSLGDYEGLRELGYDTTEIEAMRALEKEAAQLGIDNQKLQQYLAVGDYDALKAMGFDVTALETASERETELYNMEMSKAQQQNTLDAIDYALATGDFSKLGDAGLSEDAIDNIEHQYNNATTANDYATWQIRVEKAVATGNVDDLKDLGFADADIEAMLNPATEEEFGGLMNRASAVYDDDGNLTGYNYYNRDTGKEFYYDLGINPYGNGMHRDVMTDGEYDPSKAFSNGYQPNNIGGTRLHEVPGASDTVNDREQSIFYAPDEEGVNRAWIWDGEHGDYREYEGEDGKQMVYVDGVLMEESEWKKQNKERKSLFGWLR